MKISSVYNKVIKAIKEFDLISEKDNIAIGISGGKDSMALLYILNNLKNNYLNFNLYPITLDMGFNNFNLAPIKEFISKMNLELHVIESNLSTLIFEDRKEKNPCSLCSKMRRGILNKYAKSLNCTKLALGHHQDDIVTTTMLSLMYEGKFKSISPISYMDNSDMHLLRPLTYVKESEIISLVQEFDIPVLASPCPVDKVTKRREMESMLKDISLNIPNVSDKIFSALKDKNFLK